MRIRHLTLVSIIAVTGAGVAAAATAYKLKQDTFTTDLSGPETAYVYVSRSDPGQLVYGVDIWEEQDRPCQFRARSRHINTNQSASDVWTSVFCDPNASTKKSIQFEQTDEYVRGVQACLNNDRTKIKGIKIFGARLDRATGNLTDISAPKKLERTNCKYWVGAKYCPHGQVAHQIRLGLKTFSAGAQAANSIGLVCREVVPKQ